MKNEGQTIFLPERAPLQITFLVFAGASIMCVASAIDPLRAANRIVGERLFDFRLVSVDGEAPETSCGLPIAVAARFDPEAVGDALILVGGFGARQQSARNLLINLRKAAKRARAIGAVEAGSWALGHAGLLAGRSATTHWEDIEDFAAAFPQADVRPDRYVIDGPVFASGGAAPTFDLMLHLIRSRLGMAVALDVASVFIYDQSRAPNDAQPLVSLGRLDGYDPKLVTAIRLMESHLDRPLPMPAIARRCGVTVRTLEKLFARAVGQTPGAYALRLRLAAARRLVLDTSEPMAMIAARTGFASAASFSRSFAKAFGQPPAGMRRG